MQKKKIGPGIILAAFIIVICCCGLLWFFLEKYADSENYENRELTARPELTVDNYGTFAGEYETYFNDNLPFRSNLITLNAAIDYFVFHQSTSDYVIAGNDNWLFYSRTDDGDPVACYQGTNLFSEEQLAAIAQNCVNQRDFLADQGVEFVLFIAPNKERVYYENMPEQYGLPAETYQALQLVEYLRANTDLRVVYPYEELLDAKDQLEQNIWYKTDTHWNWIGGYVGATALLQELGIEMPPITSDQISIVTGDHTSGDLANMLSLSKQLKFADYDYSVEGYDTHDMEAVDWDFNNAIIYHATDADPRKIYVLRDSFSTHMSVYIGSQFNDSCLRHRYTYTYDDFVAQDPDIFVYETVERYLYELSAFSVQ